MGIVLHSERCCGGHGASFGHHGHSHHGNSNHSHRRRTDLTYSPLIDDRSELEIDLESPVDNKQKKKHHKNINVRAAFIHVIGDIIQSIGVLIASFIIKFTVSMSHDNTNHHVTWLTVT